MEILAMVKRRIGRLQSMRDQGDCCAALAGHLSRLTVGLIVAGDLQPLHPREQG